LQILIDHPLGGEAFAGALVRAAGVVAAEIPIFAEALNYVGKAVGVVRSEINGVVSPDLAEARNIVGQNGAARECRF